MRKLIDKIVATLAILALLAFVSLVSYGLDTQCPDVAVYVYCGSNKN